MLYELGYINNADINTIYETQTFTVLAPTGQASLRTNRGSFYRGDVHLGTTVTLSHASTISLRMPSSTSFLKAQTATITQDNFDDKGYIVEGQFTLITKADPSQTLLIPATINTPTYEPYAGWTPTDDSSLTSIDLSSELSNQIPNDDAALLADFNLARDLHFTLDPHFDRVRVYATDTEEHIGNITGDKPTAAASVFSAKYRRGTAILFENAGAVSFYDNDLVFVASTPIVNAIGLVALGADTFICLQSDSKYTVITVDEGMNPTSAIEHATTEAYTQVVTNDDSYWLLKPTKVYDPVQDIAYTIPDGLGSAAAYTDTEINKTFIYITHGHIPKVTLLNVTDTTQSTIDEGTFLGPVTVSVNGDVAISDLETNEVFLYNSVLFKLNTITVTNTPLGIGLQNNKLLVTNMYSDQPSRYSSVDEFHDKLTFADYYSLVLGQEVTTTTYTPVDYNVNQPVSVISRDADVELIHNGVTAVGPVVLEPGDTIAFRFTPPAVYDYFGSIRVIIGPEVYDFYINTISESPLPDELVWNPQFDVTTSTQYESNELAITGLDGASINVTVANGILVHNGTDTPGPILLMDGDTLSVKQTSSDTNCITSHAIVDFGGFKTTYSITTGLGDSGTTPNWTFPTIDQQPLDTDVLSDTYTVVALGEGETTVISISNLYDAQLLLNGVLSGQSIVVRDGDEVQVKMTTSFYSSTEHHIPISMCGDTWSWIVITLTDIVPLPFVFDPLIDVHPKDRQTSNTVTLLGVDADEDIPIKFPAGVKAFINDVAIAGDMDYNDVYISTVEATVRKFDTIRLEGYVSGVWDVATDHIVTCGGTRSYWRIKPFELEGAERDLFNFFLYYQELFTSPLAAKYLALTLAVDYAISPVRSPSILHEFDGPEPKRTPTVVHAIDSERAPVVVSAPYIEHEALAAYRKNPGRIEVDSGYSPVRTRGLIEIDSNKQPIVQQSGLVDLDLHEGIEVYNKAAYAFEDLFPNRNFVIRRTEIPLFNHEIYGIDSKPVKVIRRTITVDFNVQPEKAYTSYRMLDTSGVDKGVTKHTEELNQEIGFHDYPTKGVFEFPEEWAEGEVIHRRYYYQATFFEKQDTGTTQEIDAVFNRQLPSKPYEIDAVFARWVNDDTCIDSFPGFYPPLPERSHLVGPDRHWFDYIEFDGWGFTPTKPPFTTVDIQDPDKFYTPFRVYDIENPQTYEETRKEFDALDPEPKLRITRESEIGFDISLKSTVEQAHLDPLRFARSKHVISNKEPEANLPRRRFVEVEVQPETNRASYVQAESTRYLTEVNVTLSPVNLLDAGYFATSELAAADATSEGLVVGEYFTFEVEPNVWVWTRDIPCENLCVECPPRGYINGG